MISKVVINLVGTLMALLVWTLGLGYVMLAVRQFVLAGGTDAPGALRALVIAGLVTCVYAVAGGLILRSGLKNGRSDRHLLVRFVRVSVFSVLCLLAGVAVLLPQIVHY